MPRELPLPEPTETAAHVGALIYVVAESGRRTSSGSTRPRHGSIAAVLKEDGTEVPTCVYNELVASRLAELFDVPMALGVLSEGQPRPRFASLIAATSGARLPPVDDRLAKRVATRYPQEVAAVLAFDVLIGNWDRGGNLKAATATARSFICGFDHSHAVLAAKESVSASIQALDAGTPILRHHVFGAVADRQAVLAWAHRMQMTPSEMVWHRCVVGAQLPNIPMPTQRALADALVRRAARLPEICLHVLELNQSAP